MKHLFFLLFVCIGSYGAFAQGGFFAKNTHIEKWYRKGDNLETEIKKVILLPEFQSVVKEYGGKVESLTSCFHFIDFNNNGELDILFDGKIGDQDFVFIFLKKETDYWVVLEQKGTIIEANLPEEDSCLNVSIWHGACCGDYVNSYTQLVCMGTSDTNYFNTESKSLIFKGTILPFVRIKAPVECTVVNITHLRTDPGVDKQRRIAGSNSWVGNSLGIYPINATGTIYAEMKDDRNKYWYFVRMNNEPELRIYNDRFTYTKEIEEEHNFFYYGWICSDDVSFE